MFVTVVGTHACAGSALVLLCLVFSLSALGQAPVVQPNYQEADIKQVIEAVGEVTGRNFVVDPRVQGPVTLIAATPMTTEAFYQAFLSVLAVHGFIAIEGETVTRIVPDEGAFLWPGSEPGGIGDQLVTRLITLSQIERISEDDPDRTDR